MKPLRAEEIAESFANGNISWVRKEIGRSKEKYAEVREVLGMLYPESVEKFVRVIGMTRS